MKKFSTLMAALGLIFSLALFSACEKTPNTIEDPDSPDNTDQAKVDDWNYNPEEQAETLARTGGGGFFNSPQGSLSVTSASPSPMGMMMDAAMESESLGFAVGGANDINNFRENIENDYLPLFTDITYEGLFYDYFFDTGQNEECKKLFCPSYSYAISKDPFSQEDEYYLQVGLNSNIKESDFERKKLNLVVVLDISGSMGSNFNKYYYDQPRQEVPLFEQGESPTSSTPLEDPDAGKSKMEIANKAIVGLLDHLNNDDRFGMVVFDDQAYLAKGMNEVGETNIEAIKEHILDLEEKGGTNMEAGMRKGTELFDEYLEVDPEEYENRIIFLTDAMPNLGALSEGSLLGITERNADNNLSTTFIGVGVDFNTELIEAITKVRGANYYSVHSAQEFKTRMDDEFEFMVTPLVFNLSLQLESEGFEIEKVYGSPEADEATGEIMRVNTLFPSKSEGGETKGGIVILKLRKTGNEDSVILSTSYEDRSGNEDGQEVEIDLTEEEADYYGNDGIRKGILLSRYTNLMKNWIYDEREHLAEDKPVFQPRISDEVGIILPPYPPFPELGQWERQSIELEVSDEYKTVIEEFKKYFEEEMDELDDEDLKQELEILEKLIQE